MQAHCNMVWFLYTDITVTLGYTDNGSLQRFSQTYIHNCCQQCIFSEVFDNQLIICTLIHMNEYVCNNVLINLYVRMFYSLIHVNENVYINVISNVFVVRVSRE